jgi:hypothetical protein
MEQKQIDVDHIDDASTPYPHDHNLSRDSEEEEVYEFDLPAVHFVSHTEKRHQAIARLLGLYGDESLRKTFLTIITLIDPVTQPMESDVNVISLQLVSDLVISLRFNPKSIVADFELGSQLFKIIQSSLNILNCNDEVRLRGINNSDLKVDWRLKLDQWTPHGLNSRDLRLIYMINCACLFTIYRIYAVNEPDLCLNPFLGFFLKLWKIFTNVVLLGLEIDRRVEKIQNQSTPTTVKQVIRGSTAVRYVLAAILNDDVENRFHDFNHLNIVDFMSPYGRRNGTGGLYADVRWYVGAMLALGSELNEVVETLVDLEPNDRYDEDVRYMFDFEYDDFHHDVLYPEDYNDEGAFINSRANVYEDEDGNFHKIVNKRCTCQFFDDELDEEEDGDSIEDHIYAGQSLGNDNSNIGIPTAVRSTDDVIEFDEEGRDWRDVPREGNIFFNPKSQLNPSDCYNWVELTNVFDEMSIKPISKEMSQKVINSIARAVKNEFEQGLLKKNEETEEDPLAVTPDKIYERWSQDSIFEKMLALNPQTSYCMLDEMFMTNGYRRVLIWFITHMALSFSLMVYIFELTIGLRGENPERKQKYIFSRQGPLVLSEIEKSMLLHEFLNNCLIYLSKSYESFSNPESGSIELTDQGHVIEYEKCVKIVNLICLMINKLMENQMIDIEEYKVELTSLLINWIIETTEARDLYFKISSLDLATQYFEEQYKQERRKEGLFKEGEKSDSGKRFTIQVEKGEPVHWPKPESLAQAQFTLQETGNRPKRFNTDLKISLGNVIKKLDSGSLLFRPFFELIGHDNAIPSNLISPPTSTDAISSLSGHYEDLKNETNAPYYIKGHLKPLHHDEEYEHEKFEISVS